MSDLLESEHEVISLKLIHWGISYESFLMVFFLSTVRRCNVLIQIMSFYEPLNDLSLEKNMCDE